jgi:GNAT superfamily N-acetyltransferase
VTLTVRIAGADDVLAVAAMRRAWTEEYVGERIEDDAFLDTFAAWFEQEAGQRVTWLAEVTGDPVGMLNMLVFTRMPRPRRASDDRPTQWGYIANFFVDATRRNAGIGRRLLDAATEYAVQHHFARILLSPSERAVALYARAGFTPATSLMMLPLP